MSRWSVEAWEIPGASPFRRRVMDVPGVLEFTQPASGVGRCKIGIPDDWGRLDEILDPASDIGSLLRIIETDRSGDPQIRAEYLLRRTETPRSDAGNIVILTAPSIENALEWVVVYPYDWPPEIFTPNWIYGAEGAEGSFSNGGLEEFNLNGDAETGEVTPWESTTAGADVKVPDSDLTIDTSDPRNGTRAFEVDPSGFHSGMVLRGLSVVPGSTVVFQGYLKEPSNSGQRFTMGIQMGDGSTLDVGAKIYNDIGLAELDGAAYFAGATDGTYQVLNATVTFGPAVTETNVFFQYDEHPTGNGALFRVDDITITGFGIGVEPWKPLGTLDTFELDTATFDEGTQSLKFKVGAASGADASGVRQVVTGLTIGRTYTWSQKFVHDNGGNEPIKMVAKRPSGVWLAAEVTQIPTGATFTYAAVTFVADTTEIWLDVRYNDAGASPTINMDTGNFAEGLQPATVGEIILALLADAQTDHTGEAGDLARETLTWLKADFSATVDSAGNSWRADESLVIVRGKTYGQVLGSDFAKLGYEYRIKPNPSYPSDTESHILQVFNPADLDTRVGGASNDLVGSVAFSGGSVTKGPVVKTPKSRTVALAEGDAFQFAVAKDAAGVTAWGARELYLAEDGVLDPSTLTQAASTALTERGAAITATRLTIVDDDVFSPFIDFDPGDWVRGELPPDLPRGNHRVVAITGVIAEGNSTFDIDIGAHVYVGASGMNEAVSRLLSEFDGIEKAFTQAATGVGKLEPFTGPIETTFLVAASNARPEIRRLADFKCDGVDDEEEINAALAAVQAASSDGGIVQLTGGTFFCGDQIASTSGSKAIWLRGAGRGATRIESDGSAPFTRAGLVEIAAHHATLTDIDVSVYDNGYIAAIDIDVTSNSAGAMERVTAYMGSPSDAVLTSAIAVGNDMTLTDVEVGENSKGDGIVVHSARVNIDGAQIHSATTDGGGSGLGIAIFTTNAHHCRIHDSFIENCAGEGIFVASDDCIVVGNDAEDGILIHALADRTILGGNRGTIINNGTLTRVFDESGLFNGTFLEIQSATISEAGGTVTMSLEKEGGGELTMRFSDGRTRLDTDPALTIALTTGADDAPTTNYIYILQSDKILTKSTSDWPATEHIKVAFFFVPSATFVAANGVIIQQDWTDHEDGHLADIVEHIRHMPAVWHHGLTGAGTSDYLTLAGTTVHLKIAAGHVYQLHEHEVPAFDTSTGGVVLVKNWFGDAYHDITNLYDIVDDSGGNTIVNNRYFNIVVWGVANQTGGYDPVLINLPAGTYTSQAAAEADLTGHDDFTIPREFINDSSTGFLICRLTVQKKTNAWEYKSTTDLRGTNPQSASGGASATTTTFLDNQWKVVSVDDVTKILQLDLGSVTTGTTRTLIVPDADGTIALEGAATDADAIHDNVAAEISAITAKGTPVDGDFLLIEDSAAANVKKSITIGDLPDTSDHATPIATHAALPNAHHDESHDVASHDDTTATGAELETLTDGSDADALHTHSADGIDTSAIHDNESAEISAVTEKVSPVGADLLLIEDSAAGNAKKRIQITNLPGGTDADAIHDNVASEISAITAKATPVGGDFLIIEDSAAANAKKSVTVAALEAILSHDNIAGVTSDDHHAEAHNVASHSDTTATGTELETLTDGSNADALHAHAHTEPALDDVTDVTITAVATGEVITKSAGDWINRTLAEAGISADSHTHLEADVTDLDHASPIATHAALPDAHHNESHTVVSHSDTTATGAELETLTDGSNADSLHAHAGATGAAFSELMLMGA